MKCSDDVTVEDTRKQWSGEQSLLHSHAVQKQSECRKVVLFDNIGRHKRPWSLLLFIYMKSIDGMSDGLYPSSGGCGKL